MIDGEMDGRTNGLTDTDGRGGRRRHCNLEFNPYLVSYTDTYSSIYDAYQRLPRIHSFMMH